MIIYCNTLLAINKMKVKHTFIHQFTSAECVHVSCARGGGSSAGGRRWEQVVSVAALERQNGRTRRERSLMRLRLVWPPRARPWWLWEDAPRGA